MRTHPAHSLRALLLASAALLSVAPAMAAGTIFAKPLLPSERQRREVWGKVTRDRTPNGGRHDGASVE